MPIETSIDSSGRVFRTAARGTIRYEDLEAFQRTFEHNVQRDWLATELVNLADAQVAALSTEDVVHIAKRNARFLREIEVPRPRIAIFSPADLQFGLSRVFEAWTTGDNGAAEVGVFRELERAERWLLAS